MSEGRLRDFIKFRTIDTGGGILAPRGLITSGQTAFSQGELHNGGLENLSGAEMFAVHCLQTELSGDSPTFSPTLPAIHLRVDKWLLGKSLLPLLEPFFWLLEPAAAFPCQHGLEGQDRSLLCSCNVSPSKCRIVWSLTLRIQCATTPLRGGILPHEWDWFVYADLRGTKQRIHGQSLS